MIPYTYTVVERWIQGVQGVPGVGALTSTGIVTFVSNPIGDPYPAVAGTRVRVDGRAGRVGVLFPIGTTDQLVAVVDLYAIFWTNKPALFGQSGQTVYDNGSIALVSPAAITSPGGIATYGFIFDPDLNAWIPAW